MPHNGRVTEVFVLDARSYRDRNDTPDTPENNKAMLGADQIAWLVDGIQRSTATWKIVSSDVPLSIPTGNALARDGWARLASDPAPTGFRSELQHLMSELDRINAENVVFVATDVHYAQNLAYEVDANGDGDTLRLHELVRGPANAVRNPAKTVDQLDPTLNPTSLYSEGGIFNFGYVSVGLKADGKVHLVADVRGGDGAARPGSTIDLIPQ